MQFRTVIPVAQSSQEINYGSSVHSVGSCFAVNMAAKLEYYQFSQHVNPFGILFSPQAILQYFRLACGKEDLKEEHFICHNEVWNYLDAHSSLASPDRDSLQESLQSAIDSGRSAVADASHLLITLGTAWVYRKLSTGTRVANCHKLPQQEFSKELMNITEIKACLEESISLIRGINSGCSIIFSVSPVRHIKDGFVENNRSKSHLISALQDVLAADQSLGYFPAYEIVMDELRDYRFYADDMLHPSAMAIDYIWNRFSENYIQPDTRKIMTEVDSIQRALAHRAFNPDSGQHKKFIIRLNERIEVIRPLLPSHAFQF